MQSQFRWADHVVRIKDHRLPKKLLHGELSQSRLSHGGQKKRFKDTLKVSQKSFCIVELFEKIGMKCCIFTALCS